jgi:hypothetical protein
VKKKPVQRPKRSKKPAQNDNPLIAFITLFVLGVFLVLIIVFHKSLIALIPQTGQVSYQQDFASGKKVIWYDETGIFMYEDAAKDNQALVNFPLLQTFPNPVLSPDNKKIVYLVQTTNYPNAKFELWIYDFITKKQSLLVKDFKSSSAHPYAWAKDSHSLFVILQTENKHKLFKITFDGKKTQLASDYTGDVYANLSGPDVINDNFAAFSTCDQACEKRIGIVDIKKNKTFFVSAPKESDSTTFIEIDDTHALQVNIHELPKAQVDDIQRVGKNKIIVGLEKISLTTQKGESIPLPKEVILHDEQRIQAAGMCGDSVLVGLVGTRDRVDSQGGYKEEYYTRYYLYNIAEQRLIKFIPSWGCNKQGQVYSTSSSIHEPLAIKKIDLANVSEGKEIKYSRLLSEEILAQFRRDCLGIAMLATGSSNGNDFVYIDVGTYMGTQNFTQDESLCDKTTIEKFSGIYRLSNSENTVKKLNTGYATFHRFHLIEPNP